MGEMADYVNSTMDGWARPKYIKARGTNVEIILKNVRLAFFNGYAPGEYDGKLSYGAKLILPPNHPQIAAMEEAMKEAAKAKFKANWQAIYNQMDKQDRLCFHKSEYLNKEGKPHNGFQGMYYINTSSKPEQPPLCLKANKSISALRDGDLYSGCYADVKINTWGQQHAKGGVRINAQCLVFQKRADGDAFAGGPPPSADGMDDLSDVGETVDDMIG